MSRQSIMDMDLSGRIKEIQATEGRQKAPIEIAGPAGNPTQPVPCKHCYVVNGHAGGCPAQPTGGTLCSHGGIKADCRVCAHIKQLRAVAEADEIEYRF